jgi:type II secretory pathway pseudopilin PulG
VHSRHGKHSGYLLTETAVALSLLGILLAGLGLSLHGFAKFNRHQLTRQQCIAAAQAQLDSIAATGKPVPDEDMGRLWPKLNVTIGESAGTGQWEGLKLVEVTASGKSFGKEVQVRLSRYILAKEGQ